jgi:hypothetical protein
MAKTIFDHLKSITKDKIQWDSLSEEDKKSWDDYMITRWLSMTPDYIPFLNDLQMIRGSTFKSKDYYNMLLYSLPNRYAYVKYIKKPRTYESNKDLLEFFASHYKISKREALDMMNIFRTLNLKNEFESMLSMCGLQENEKKKLIKELFNDKEL